MKPRIVEGVAWHRFIVRYTLANAGTARARRRHMVRWSPGFPWVREEVGRELVDRFGLEGIKPGSVTVEAAP